MLNNKLLFKCLIPFVFLVSSCKAQQRSSPNSRLDCYVGINKTDRKGMPQGYWKNVLQDTNGHFRIICEGMYFNGNRVGVWKRTSNDGTQLFQQHIFMDTTETIVQEINFDLAGRLASKGMLTTRVIKDSIQTIDLITNEIKWDTTVRQLIKQGFWEYFWPNGRLKGAGFFTNNKENGLWNFYNEKGDLIKTQDY